MSRSDTTNALEVIGIYLNELPDFVSNQFSLWVPIAIQIMALEGENCKAARDCCDAISRHSGVFQTRQQRSTGNYYLKQSKRFKGLRSYRGISLGMARDIILRLLMHNGVSRYYVYAKDADSDLWYLQTTALRHQDAFLSANLLTNKLGATPLRVLPCCWPVPSPITEEQMVEQENKIRLLAWHLDQNQQGLIDHRERGHDARKMMAEYN